MKRRSFAKAGMLSVAAGLSGCAGTEEKPVPVDVKKEPVPYGIQYYQKAKEVWDREATSELPLIAEAADKAAELLKNGGTLYSQANFGHMLNSELRQGRPGSPDYFSTWEWTVKSDVFDVVGAGDFLIFDATKMGIQKAHDRGAFTVGVRVPYVPNKTVPAGVLSTYSFTDNLLTEDVSDIVLTTGVPFTNGVLHYPEVPAVRPCPLSVQGVGNIMWMLNAEIAMRDKGGASAGATEKALEFITAIRERGAKIAADIDRIDEIAKAMTGYISEGGRYWNYSSGCEMVLENIARASGLPLTNRLSDEMLADDTKLREEVKAGHFCIISGEASDIEGNYEAAQHLKSIGAHVIYIGPAATEGSSGNDIASMADWHIDTYSPERYGILDVPGFDRKICPATGMLYALSLWMLNAQFIQRMIEADMTPGFDMGGHLIGGNGYNNDVRPIVKERGW